MRLWRSTSTILLGVALSLVFTSACHGPGASGDDATVATVNGEAITESALREALLAQLGAPVLVEMIDEELIRQTAKAQGLKVSDDAMKLRLENAMSQAGGEAGFRDMLKARGWSEQEFRQRLEREVLLDQIAERTIAVSETQIAQYYEANVERYSHGPQVRARLLLCSTQENAQALREALEAGGNFAGLAREFSEDPATKGQGGDMGWFERKDWAPEIADRAFAMEAGELSPVFQGPDGWYLLKVEDKRPPGPRPLAEVRAEIESSLRYARLPAARKQWLLGERAKVKIEIREENLAKAVRRQLETAPPLGNPML